ncbi:MAG: hypothetical protein J6A01_08580, partial [Proteobacteria bacterium]|nr:hypothetical protein [Pseudomonadota bacterium]
MKNIYNARLLRPNVAIRLAQNRYARAHTRFYMMSDCAGTAFQTLFHFILIDSPPAYPRSINAFQEAVQYILLSYSP